MRSNWSRNRAVDALLFEDVRLLGEQQERQLQFRTAGERPQRRQPCATVATAAGTSVRPWRVKTLNPRPQTRQNLFHCCPVV